jgi:hypothetical protein
MADDADLAQIQIEAELANARLAAQSAQKLLPSGHCHNCDEPLRPGHLFCGQECAMDYEKRERGLALRGH